MRAIVSILAAGVLLGAATAPVACSTHSSSAAESADAAPVQDASVSDQLSPDAEAALPPLESAPPPFIAPANRANANSTPVVYDALRGGVWTANGDVGSVSYVDVDTPKLVAEIPVGQNITSVGLSPDALFLAAVDRDGATVSLIDATSRAVLRAIPVGTHPRACLWDPWDPRYLYVALEDDGGVGVIDRTLGVYVQTIPVGRLVSGLTALAAADANGDHYLYVTQRVDATITRVSLGGMATPPVFKVMDKVTLAVQPSDSTLTVPQGKPFAFEAGAFTTDPSGIYTYMWIPHELLAPTHPFQFQSLVFPAVSVVDYSMGAGVEAVTDPNDPNGVVAGRKVLFGAIDILEPTGATAVMSQLNSIVMNPPNATTGGAQTTAFVLASGSEDLLTFDLTQGIAVDMLRNLPGDHPVGLTSDTGGRRLFVVSDQSKTLLRLDSAGGDLTGHVTVIGDPIPLIAQDTVAPAKRAGLTLFYRANSSKGTLATTGNNWLSCAACHLDGFVTTNAFLFEASHVANEATDAQIGHAGLKDLFSTAPTPTSSAFDPHDILVAFTDMGGLAPDRTGASRAGAVEPSSPTPAASLMASEVAEVVERDLPNGPSWELAQGAPLDESYDGAWCGGCHAAEYQAWQQSAHAHASADPMVKYCNGVEQGLVGNQFSRQCAGCHDPVSVRLGDTSMRSGRSITCLGCHDVSRLIEAGGNGDLVATTQSWNQAHKLQALAELPRLRSPQFCSGCHEQFVPGTGLSAITTYNEYEAGPFASGSSPTLCVDCHMPVTDGTADHRVVGGNVYMAQQFGGAAMTSAVQTNLAGALSLAPTRNADGSVSVAIHNIKPGHGFPTGVTDIREAWVELDALAANQKVVASYGGPDATTGVLPLDAARLGIDLANASGTLLYHHEVSEALSIPFDRRVPPAGTVSVSLTPPATLPAGATQLVASLYYRNVRTPYYQAATGSSTATAPATLIAQVAVPQ